MTDASDVRTRRFEVLSRAESLLADSIIDEGASRKYVAPARAVALLPAPIPLQPAPQLPSSTARTMAEWLADPSLLVAPSVVLPHVVVAGRVTLLSAREKTGKSTLLGSLIAASSNGSDVLGIPINGPLTTLWYCLDEPAADCLRRFQHCGANPAHVVINDHPRTMCELRLAIEVDSAAYPHATLVVVDTLSRVFAMSGVDPNDSRQIEPLLAGFVDDCHRRNTAAVLLYHTGKAGREFRGSTAIGATVDDILTLRRRAGTDEDDFDDDAADDGRRLLMQDGRNLRGRVQLQCVEGHYQLYVDPQSPRDRIVEALTAHGSVESRTALIRLTGISKAKGLQAIKELLAERAISEEKGRLRLATGHPATRFPSPVTSSGAEPQIQRSGSSGSTQVLGLGTDAEPEVEPQSPTRRVAVPVLHTPTLWKPEPPHPDRLATWTL